MRSLASRDQRQFPLPVRVLIALALAACGAPRVAPIEGRSGPSGRLRDGRDVALSFDGDHIAALVPSAAASKWLWPPVVDSHVHLALEPIADKLAVHGVAVAVDLAEPESALGKPSPIHVLAAGPMITHGGGYPLDAWGADGYGLGCDDAACVTATIDRLASKGAKVIKVALDSDGLAPALVPIAVQAAHAKHLKVAVHALSNEGALVGGRAGADILAHTPVEPLAQDTLDAWRGRAVISTLAAFGSDIAIDNLRKLRAAKLTVLYGTDLGNLHPDGVSPEEIDLLRRAGMDDAAITDAMTTTPLEFWGFTDLGIAPGKEATLLVLDGDPRKDARVLLSPREVWLRGKRM